MTYVSDYAAPGAFRFRSRQWAAIAQNAAVREVDGQMEWFAIVDFLEMNMPLHETPLAVYHATLLGMN